MKMGGNSRRSRGRVRRTEGASVVLATTIKPFSAPVIQPRVGELRFRCGAIEEDVGVHIPKAGDKVLAVGVDNLPGFGIVLGGASDAGDAIAIWPV